MDLEKLSEPTELDTRKVVTALSNTLRKELAEQVNNRVIDLTEIVDLLLQFTAFNVLGIMSSNVQFTQEPVSDHQKKAILETFANSAACAAAVIVKGLNDLKPE